MNKILSQLEPYDSTEENERVVCGLKFRVWNGMEMVYDVMVGKFGAFYVNPDNNGLDPNDSASLTPCTTKYPDDIHVMRGTSLEDINGNEIYEGDLLRHVFEDRRGTMKGIKVVYSSHSFHLVIPTDEPSYIPGMKQPNLYNHKSLEVIGNIYEKGAVDIEGMIGEESEKFDRRKFGPEHTKPTN